MRVIITDFARLEQPRIQICVQLELYARKPKWIRTTNELTRSANCASRKSERVQISNETTPPLYYVTGNTRVPFNPSMG